MTLSPHRHRGWGARCPSTLTAPGGGVGVSVSLSPHGPRERVSASLSSPAAPGRAPAGALTGFLMRRSRRRRCSSAALRGMTSGCGSLRGRGGRGAEGAAMFRPCPCPAPRDVTARDAGGPVMAGAVRAGQRREFYEGPPFEGPRIGSVRGERHRGDTSGIIEPTSALSPPCQPQHRVLQIFLEHFHGR